jgi:hypothetical protein
MHDTSGAPPTANVARDIFAGLISGLLGAVTYVCYGALIFSGSLTEFSAVGVGCLCSAV